jgi:Glycosyltransferase family 87
MSVRGPLGATPQSGAFELRTSALDARSWVSGSRAGVLGLVGLLATGLVISLSAAQTDMLLPESVRPMPSWLAGPFGSTGLGIGHAGLIAVLALMFGAYLLVVRAADFLSPRAVLTTIAGLYALVLLAPPLLSTDIFSYQAYSRMWALYGANPYLHGPHAIALDYPLYPLIGAKWVNTPSAYGPLFTALSYPLASLSIAASVAAYKAVAALASLAVVGLVWNCARLRGIDPVRAVVLVALNPLIVVYGVGGGHNDLLMLAAVMAGMYVLLRRRERAGGGLIVAAAGIKLTAGLLLPFAIAGANRRGGRRDLLVGAGLTAVLIAGLGFALFGTGPLHLFGTIQQSQISGDWHSIPGFISTRLGLGDIGRATGLILAAAFVVTLVSLLRQVWLGRMDWITGAGWSTVALLITASSLLPWYVAWLMPLAALGADRRLWLTSLYMTGGVLTIQLIGYFPHSLRL